MRQEVYLRPGAIRVLSSVLSGMGARKVFLVTGKASYALSRAEEVLRKVLEPYFVERFCEFERNPKIEDVKRGLDIFKQQEFDTVVAVGGGSVLDMGKLIKIMAEQNVSPVEVVKHQENIRHQGVPLIAIPTTAGSGSEATHFAVVYINKIKYSVAHEYILPDVAIVDPDLTHSLPARITAVTGMDALSQAVESYWCVNSTERSKVYAKEAIELVLNNLEKAVREPRRETRHAMCKAAHLAGCAINISKTTAPHAVSYIMTSYFGIPHAHAAALTLGRFLVYNSRVSDRDIADSRGVEYVRRAIGEINCLLGTRGATASCDRISILMRRVGLKTRLSELGINGETSRDFIADSMNFERIVNNPRKVTKDAVKKILQRVK